jgi:hypothetical protein
MIKLSIKARSLKVIARGIIEENRLTKIGRFVAALFRSQSGNIVVIKY